MTSPTQSSPPSTIWQRPVHLQAKIDDDMMLFSFDGSQIKQQTIHDDLPKPAHAILRQIEVDTSSGHL